MSDTERKELLDNLRVEKSKRSADRIRVILGLDQGLTYKIISEVLHLDNGTISNYRDRYESGGLRELLDDNYSTNNRSMLTENEMMSLSLHLETHTYLSSKDIIAYIKKTYKVEYTVSGVTKLLKRMGFSYKKPKRVPGKANRKRQEEFIKLYRELKGRSKVYFNDATHPHHNPVIAYGWFKKGIEFDVLTNSGRFHLNINGALCLDDLDIVTRKCKTVNGDSVSGLLTAIRKKNPLEKHLTLVLDNAPYNRSLKSQRESKRTGHPPCLFTAIFSKLKSYREIVEIFQEESSV